MPRCLLLTQSGVASFLCVRLSNANGCTAKLRATLWLGWNNRRACPVLREKFYEQYAKRLVRLVLGSVCKVPRFKKVIPGTIDRHIPSFSECKFAGKHISNPRANMVMHTKVSPWGKRHFSGSHFVLTVDLRHVHVTIHSLL